MLIVIQGASSGIGLAMCEFLLRETTSTIVATTRTPARLLDQLSRRTLAQPHNAMQTTNEQTRWQDRFRAYEMDVKSEASIAAVAQRIAADVPRTPLEALINVGGMLHVEKSLQQCSMASAMETFQVNTLAHLFTFKHFLPLVTPPLSATSSSSSFISSSSASTSSSTTSSTSSSFAAPTKPSAAMSESGPREFASPHRPLARLISLSARTGSIADNQSGGWYTYRSSKAALNQVIRTLSHEVRYRRIPAIAAAIHPGTVATGLSEGLLGNLPPNNKILTPEQSCAHIWHVMQALKPEDNGRYLDWRGQSIPW